MKWGTLFPADYVNVLFNACRRQITGPFRFVCLTDDSSGFVAGIDAFPIPDIGLTRSEWYTKGVWPKLAIYRRDLYGLTGRCLFIDLDMLVVGPLDDLFTWGGRFVTTDMGQGWRPGGRNARREPGTCIFAFDLGAETQILDRFLADKPGVMSRFRNEQDFAGAHASTMDYWPVDWVISFKRFLRQPFGVDFFVPPRQPPPGTRVVAFHGDPRPAALLPARAGFWDRVPRLGHGQVRWVADYWTAHGGRLPRLAPR
jgi:hypothetical protein